MGPNQTLKLLPSKGNHKQNKRQPTDWEKIFAKWCDWQRLNFQNIQTVHTAQYQKQTNKQTIQSKNGKKTEINISPKNIYRWPTGTWKDAPNC